MLNIFMFQHELNNYRIVLIMDFTLHWTYAVNVVRNLKQIQK